ncbi:MAG: outer membrane protein assembly factor BamA [Legionella sp.]|nr:outer membrane protein assembly factor BamA [Legionella sp.]
MKNRNKKIGAHLGCVALLSWSMYANAAESFVVQHIQINGLHRVSQGTVLNYLPVQTGEEISTDSTPQIIRTLYETGFFQSVSLERQGNTLIVNVVERPTLASITVIGNKEIPSDKMKDFLKQMGLVKGRVFQRSSLEHFDKELKQVYSARGKYNSRVETKVTTLTDNRVAVKIDISEGRVSRIKEIKFTGNHDFSKSELLSEFALSEKGVFTYFTKQDQYSKANMDASLEAIRSFYLDRGYLKMKIVSSQVLLSPDKKDVYIYVRIEEGAQYRFSGYAIRGQTILPEKQIRPLIQIRPNEVFSRKKVTESVSDIGLALGNKGYGFPVINAEPRIDEGTKTVFITFVIEPGRPVYVRHINFHGNTMTGDYVLRNVVRQDEGTLLSLRNVKESERQLRVLGYLKNVNIKTTPVPGTNNQVDLDIEVEEAPSAEATASAGYGTTGAQFNAAFNQHNFMGTGRSVGVAFNASTWGQDYSISYYNPFYSRLGIGRGLNFYYQTVNPKKVDVSAYSADRLGLDMNYNVLLSEKSSFQFGYGYQNLQVQSPGIVLQLRRFLETYGRNFHEIRLTGGWNANNYDKIPFPDAGSNQQISALAALAATSNSLSYYKASYQGHWYQPLGKGFIFTALGNLGFGNAFKSHGLPFFENYYAGGITMPGQVRGYESYTLGPKDSQGNALGANFLANGSVGLILPYPLSRDNLRSTVFVDAGNVFSVGTPSLFSGTSGGPLRFSTGLGIEWNSPFGPLAFSVAAPLNKQRLDNTQIFQFTMASGF